MIKVILLFVALWVIFTAVRELNWGEFLKDNTRKHLSFISVLILVAIWALKTGIREGLEVHFLGLTALTLMLGWRLSIIIASVATLVVTVIGVNSWSNFGENLLFGAIWPVSLSYFIFLLTYSYMYRHLFIYIFIAGFFNGVLTLTTKMFMVGLYLALTGVYSWDAVKADYLLIIPLVALPEGLMNGVTIAAMVVYRPEWVCTFRDRDYLFKK